MRATSSSKTRCGGAKASGVLTRDEAIEAMESAPPWASYDLQDPRVIVLTPDSVRATRR